MPPRTKNPASTGGGKQRKPAAKKQKMAEGTSSDPPRFVSEAAEKRYKEISTWQFTAERRVDLKPSDAPEFMHILSHRNWSRLADASPSFDPEIVREFYANAWCSVSADGTHLPHSTVRGVRIHFDRDTIDGLLNDPHPNSKYEEHVDDYHQILASDAGFDREAVFDLLCRPRYRQLYSVASARLKRSHMTPTAQLMMQFMFANLAPNLHVNDIVTPMCEFLYCCLREDLDVDAASRISEEILGNVAKTVATSGKHRGTKPRLIFPALITDLCYGHDLEVETTAKIQAPINARYVRDYCKPDEEAPEEDAAMEEEGVHLSHDLEELYQRLSLREDARDARIHARLDRQDAMLASLHRGVAYIYDASYRREFLDPAAFRAHMQWPEDSPHQPGEAGADDGNPPLG